MRIAVEDLSWDSTGTGSVRLDGKGRKIRFCPLWKKTMEELKPLIAGRAEGCPVFVNRYGDAMTRFGLNALVERYVQLAGQSMPSLTKKRISPHTIRHTTATHLLRAGVDINTIRAWLGHVSIETTNVYAETDLAMKAKALEACRSQHMSHLTSQEMARRSWPTGVLKTTMSAAATMMHKCSCAHGLHFNVRSPAANPGASWTLPSRQ